ncbi:MAG: c-type cytochrome [Acidobacteria bacterium]|nr:c-type cytochrome [Acidobacteriota bacterium]
MARNLRKIAIPSDAKEMQNPYPLTLERLQAAQQHWVEHCAMCHSLAGSGDTGIGRNLYPKPPDMRTALTQDLSDGELYYIIHNGIRFTGMPAWSDADGPEEIWELVSFIRRLPHLTPEELGAMEQLAAGHVDDEHGESPMPVQGTESNSHQH